MKQWDISEAARRLHELVEQDDTHIVWFLGAGCSISSGIAGAGTLVERWMKGLQDLKGDAFDEWALDNAPGWERSPGRYYGTVIDERFGGNRRARQEEIARLVRGKEPGFGYACLAQLMAHKEFGRRNNLAFTTNFDDLIADALYLYTQQKPLTVVHEALAGFLRSSESTPLVVKLHGDSQLAPKNTVAETSELDVALVNALRRVLRDAVFVFIGYGGNDESIASFLEGCRRDEIAGAFWIGRSLPGNARFRSWLTSLEGAVHVDHQDFDSFMAELRAEFKLGSPDFGRFDRLRERYEETAQRARRQPDATARGAVSAEKAIGSLGAWRLDAEARALGLSDPERRRALHTRAASAAPSDGDVLGNFALFLDRIGDPDARAVYEHALEADPDHVNNLRNFGVYLHELGDFEGAEALLRQARRVDPGDVETMVAYATHAGKVGRTDEAQQLFTTALETDPTDAAAIGLYAFHLAEQGKDDEAERLFQRALALDPTALLNVANHAWFAFRRGDRARARANIESALGLSTDDDDPLPVLELDFYAYADRTPGWDDALSSLKRLLQAGLRSHGWDFSPVIEAVAGDWRDTTFLNALAEVAAGTTPIETLEAFPEWRDA